MARKYKLKPSKDDFQTVQLKMSTEKNGDIVHNDDEPEEKKGEQMPMVGMAEMFRFADTQDKFLIVLGIFFACLHGSAMPLMVIVFGEMTDTFINGGTFDNFWNQYGEDIETTTNYTKEEVQQDPAILQDFFESMNMTDIWEEVINTSVGSFLGDMQKYSLYYCILGLAITFVSAGNISCWLRSSYRQCQRIRVELLSSILQQEIGWFDTHEVGELNTRLADDVNKIQDGLGEKLGQFFQWFTAFIVGFTVGFVRGWKLTLVILAVSPLLAISGMVMNKLGSAFTSKELGAYAKAGAVAEECLSGIRTVVAFGGEQKECMRYNQNLVQAKDFGIRKGMINGAALGMVFFIMYSSYALAFWYGTDLVIRGEYTGGKVLIVFFSVLTAAFSLGNAAPNLQYFATGRGAAHVVYGIIDQEPNINSSSDEGMKLERVTGNIEFKDIHFSYPSRKDVKVLQGLNVQVKVGQTVALVGSSGCGKSTTIQLLQRFYDPNQGSIKLDGVNIKDLNVQWLRRQIGVVSQEPVLFGTTIGENIRYGKDGVSQEDIERAAKEANAYDFIMGLPKKFQTLVGERGAQLSGGQKQRIAIARALVRDPKILLLDEATSALDTESEATVQAALDKVHQGRTTLIIAHRLSTIRNADVIVGIDEGKVVEIGTHDELMKYGGIYNVLYTNQTQMSSAGVDSIEALSNVEKQRTISVTKEVTKNIARSFSHASSGRDRALSIASSMHEEEDLPIPPAKRLFLLNSPEWPYMAVGFISSLVAGGTQPVFAIIFSEIMGVFSELDKQKQKDDAVLYSLLFLSIGASMGLAMFFQNWMFAICGEKLTMRLREKVFQAYMRQEMAFYDDPKNSVGSLTTRLSTDASAVQGATGSRLATMLQSLASIVIGLSIGFYFSWKLSLAICAFAPLVMLGGYARMRMMMGASKGDKESMEAAGTVATEAIINIRTVATLTKEEHFIEEYTKKTMEPHKKSMRKVPLQGIAFGFAQGVIFFAYAACFYYGAYLVENDGLFYEDMYRVITAIVFSAMSAGQASSFAPDIGKAKASAARVFKLLDSEPSIDSYSEEGARPEKLDGVVHFQDVKFNYPTRPNLPVLCGLSVSIQPGQTLALVGPSGCGKSTSIQLLERLYDPLSGYISLDNHPIKSVNIQWLRQQFGLVSQEPVLFDTSISENIAYGDNTRKVEMSEVIAAAKDANIHNFISSLPNGYDTNVGDKGAQLSGGQKQRVAIARALVREPKILLLDEATSALDTESEKVVQEALDKAREGRTCIVIAHRLSTIHGADCIAVINQGKVAEIGKHQELMKQEGIYYRLNKTQVSHR